MAVRTYTEDQFIRMNVCMYVQYIACITPLRVEYLHEPAESVGLFACRLCISEGILRNNQITFKVFMVSVYVVRSYLVSFPQGGHVFTVLRKKIRCDMSSQKIPENNMKLVRSSSSSSYGDSSSSSSSSGGGMRIDKYFKNDTHYNAEGLMPYY